MPYMPPASSTTPPNPAAVQQDTAPQKQMQLLNKLKQKGPPAAARKPGAKPAPVTGHFGNPDKEQNLEDQPDKAAAILGGY